MSSQIGRAIGKSEISVNSYHKQSADRLGRGLSIIATFPGRRHRRIRRPGFPLFAAVQWHPERVIDEPEHFALLVKMLVDASRSSMEI